MTSKQILMHIDNIWREISININVLYYSNLKESWKTWTFCGITVCSDLFYFRFCVKLNVWTRKTLFQDKFIPLTSWGTYKWHLSRAKAKTNQGDLNLCSRDFQFSKIFKLKESHWQTQIKFIQRKSWECAPTVLLMGHFQLRNRL